LARDVTEPRIRYVFEANVGLSHARNRGIFEARGDIIAFLDDDAEATPCWVQELVNGYSRHPDAWAVGGKNSTGLRFPDAALVSGARVVVPRRIRLGKR
jgi:glycosyltransferase involved in cell wall biosynthesis